MSSRGAGGQPRRLPDLAGILGEAALIDAGRLPEYAIGGLTPWAGVRPADAAGVAATLAWAQQSGTAVYPCGGRTWAGLGNRPARAGIALDLTGLDRLVDLQPADLTVRAQAGMTLAGLAAALAREGKFMPLGAPQPARATVGGTLATGASGPLRAAYGLPRDWLIGISVVAADGTSSKAGGQVVKNVTGYDLNRLYTGSLGTLGVITEAVFKLAPAPAEWAVVAAAFDDAATAVSAGRSLQSQAVAPLGLHILNPAAARLAAPDGRLPSGYGPVAVALVGGRAASVQRRLTDIAALWLERAATIHIERGDDAAVLIDGLADLPAAGATTSAAAAVCVRINAPPAALAGIMELAGQGLGRNGTRPAVAADVMFGGGRLLWASDCADDEPTEIAAGLRVIQETAAGWGGDAIVERCPDSVKEYIDVWGQEPSGMAIMRRIKGQFDPANVLNPGRFIGGL